MKSKKLLLYLVVVLILSVFVIDAVSVVSAKPALLPAMGTWFASEEGVIERLIPQFRLEAPTGGYALLQSDGVRVSGYSRICHLYPGGQFGWTSEIRAWTAAGWVGVPTENGWEPDEEGQYMTCANVGRGTYAVFGYWAKPSWWPPIAPTLPPYATLAFTPTLTSTPVFTSTPTPTSTSTLVNTPTFTPTFTPTYTPTWVNTPTWTPTFTPTNTPTNTPTFTPTPIPTFTETPLPGPTLTHTPEVT